jgi:Protein of unknown function (DUF2804)
MGRKPCPPPKKKTYSERELPNNLPIRISLPDRKLNPESIGWTRKPVQVSNLRGYALRKKRWNYWCVVTPDCLFSVTLSNVDYLGLAFAYFLDFKSRCFTEKTVMTMFGKGCDLPETVEGAVNFNHPDMKLSFDDCGISVEISVECADFGGQKLEAHLMVERPAGLESLNIIIPWSSTRYHYTSKQNCLPAGGTVTVGADSYAVDLQRDFACLDFGRGI